MYKVEIKTKEKIFLITLSGQISEQEITSYINELEKGIKSINPEIYTLVVNGEGVVTANQNQLGNIEQAMSILAKTQFKKSYSIMPRSAVASMQIKRVGNGASLFNNMTIAKSLEEVV